MTKERSVWNSDLKRIQTPLWKEGWVPEFTFCLVGHGTSCSWELRRPCASAYQRALGSTLFLSMSVTFVLYKPKMLSSRDEPLELKDVVRRPERRRDWWIDGPLVRVLKSHLGIRHGCETSLDVRVCRQFPPRSTPPSLSRKLWPDGSCPRDPKLVMIRPLCSRTLCLKSLFRSQFSLHLGNDPGRLATQPSKVVTWLILPVVICLSQRLSHACLSISNCTAKLRMAH